MSTAERTSPLDQAIGFDPLLGIEHRDRFYSVLGDCLERAGFDVPGIRQFHTKFERDLADETPLDAVYRAVHDGAGRHARVTSPIDDYADSLTPTASAAFLLAAHGDGQDPGCTHEAQTATYGTSDSASMAALLEEISARVATDEGVIRTESAWSSCMTGHGYDFARPDLATAHLEQLAQQMIERRNSGIDLKADTAAADAVAYEVALEDAYNACARDVDLAANMRNAIVQVQQQYVEEHPNLREHIRGGATR